MDISCAPVFGAYRWYWRWARGMKGRRVVGAGRLLSQDSSHFPTSLCLCGFVAYLSVLRCVAICTVQLIHMRICARMCVCLCVCLCVCVCVCVRVCVSV